MGDIVRRCVARCQGDMSADASRFVKGKVCAALSPSCTGGLVPLFASTIAGVASRHPSSNDVVLLMNTVPPPPR
jgi:hypothetical protein